MKNICISVTLLLACFTISYAMDINGDLNMELRLALSNGNYLMNQEKLALKFRHDANMKLKTVFELDFIYVNGLRSSISYDNLLTPGDIGVFYTQSPLEIELKEAYLSYSQFLLPDLDLVLGKQRIAWGKADQFNPTDLLNPADLSDPLDFSKKVPTLALNAQYYLPFLDSSIQLVYEPYSQPARLNLFFFEQLQEQLKEQIISGMGEAEVTDRSSGWGDSRVEIPEWEWKNGLVGSRFSFYLAGFDISVNAVNRANDFPVPILLNGDITVDSDMVLEADITATYVLGSGQTNIRTNSIVTNSSYQKIDINSHDYVLGYGREWELGLDFSRDMGGFLLWGEMGIYLSDEIPINVNIISDVSANVPATVYITQVIGIPIFTFTNWTTNYSVSNMTITTNVQFTNAVSDVSVSNQASVKYVIGIDKMFSHGWYGNFQFVHGLFNERGTWGPARLQDYFILAVQKTMLGEKLVLTSAGMFSINNIWNSFQAEEFFPYIGSHYGLSLQLSAAYSPIPDLKLELGMVLMDGTNSTLAFMKENDMFFTRCTYTF